MYINMPIAINYKICDQGRGCPCISGCPQRAWSFNEKKGRPEVDTSKCNDCWKCIKICPARAVLGALDGEGLKKLNDELSKYSKTRDEIYEPRFNADRTEKESQISGEEFDEKINQNGIVIIEFWAEPFASRCRLNAALYSDILPEKIPLHKINAFQNPDLMERFSISALPALLIFKDGEVIDHIAGYTSISEKEALRARLLETLPSL
jgi:thioredoxin 1